MADWFGAPGSAFGFSVLAERYTPRVSARVRAVMQYKKDLRHHRLPAPMRVKPRQDPGIHLDPIEEILQPQILVG